MNIIFTRISILALISVFLTSCIGLIPLESDSSSNGPFGPQITTTAHQIDTVNAIWTSLAENYIYYNNADLDWDSLKEQYIKRVNLGLSVTEFDQLLEDLQNDLPEGSYFYQSRTERIEQDIYTSMDYEGIGAFIGFEIEPEPHIVILSIIRGSPAERAGLKAHDSIYAINGKPVLLEEQINPADRVRGKAGSTVTLTIQSPNTGEREVEVVRGTISTNGRLEAYQIPGTNFAYLLFPPTSYEGLLQDVTVAMQVFTTNQKLDGLIVDLRIVGAAITWPIEDLFSMFGNGMIGEIYSPTSSEAIRVKGQDLYSSQSVPLIILTGKNTQGLAEVFAGSLQLQDRAIVIGASTPGNVETMAPFILPNGGRIYLQNKSFKLANGNLIGLNGITPDIVVEARWDEILPNQDPVLTAAVEVLEVLP